MHVRRIRLRRYCLPVLLSVAVASAGIAAAEKGKPSVSVKASPVSGFAPMRTVVTVELKGGADDYEEFYCATVEWDITVTDIVGAMDPNSRMSDSRQVEKSEQKADCDPYVAGKSEIKRRFVREHTFKIAGEYSIKFNLKQKNKVVGSGRTTVRVRGGLGDGIGG
jgi:hypothetical protein